MKPIILIASCDAWEKNGINSAARRTWLFKWSHLIDYKFVLGRGAEHVSDDQLILDVGDDYQNLSYKVQAARRWATAAGYGHSFHCGADTFVFVPRLLASGYEAADYTGFLIHDEHRLYKPRNIQFAQGGGGYWLSPRAAMYVEQAGVPEWLLKAEDVFVADTLFNVGIRGTHDVGYWSWGYRAANDPASMEGGLFIGLDSAITVHLSRWWGACKYSTDWMYDTYNRAVKFDGCVWNRKYAPAPPADLP